MNGPRTPLDDDEFGYAFDPPFNARRLSKRLPMSTDLDEPFDAYRWPAYPDDFPGLREMQIANGCDDIVCEFAHGFCPCREQFAASRGERRDTRGWFARVLAWWGR